MLCIMNFILRMNELTLRVMNCILWMHEGYDGHTIRRPSFIFGVPSRHALPNAIGFTTRKKYI